MRSMASHSQQHSQISNAFEEVAPSSSSSTINKGPYDVFINHRGPDVKFPFATNIYETLYRMGLRVFLDKEELESGDFIPHTLQEAMGSASVHIAIFSPNYAQSPWCLAELSFMLKTNSPIIPVFYSVRPSDLRWVDNDKSVYAAAFSEHESKGRYTPEKIHEWKRALAKVSLIMGLSLDDHKNEESSLLKSIVEFVKDKIKKVRLFVADHPVGLDDVLNELESTIGKSEQNEKIVGIVGMGGLGKTTLAKELYNRRYRSFDSSSFLFDVRASKDALHNLQMKLLEDIGAKGRIISHKDEGKEILASSLRSRRVLVVLDDVDHVDQTYALLPRDNHGSVVLGSGSLIVVTTRERSVVESWNIASIYNMKGLCNSHAEQLFCWHAFLQPYSLPGFQDMVKKFVDSCHGLPLSLKVLGGQLYTEKSKEYWESLLGKISRILPQETKDRLKVSYDALDKEEQEIFLDIACFFIGEKLSLGIEVWNALGLSGSHSLRRLRNKCLIEVDEYGRIRMHDHLRDMGKEIADMKSPIRIWSPRQINNILNQQADGRMLIRGIMAATSEFGPMDIHSYSSYYEPPVNKCMEHLRRWLRHRRPSSPSLNLLVLKEDYLMEEKYLKNRFGKLSRDLLWLRWFDFMHKNLPSWLSLNNLRVLELLGAYRLKELWVDNAHIPSQLTELIVSGCASLQKIPKSIGHLTSLKKITLTSRFGNPIPIKSLPEEFCDLKSLEHLELEKCSSLSSLPTRFGDLSNLQHLALRSCQQLRTLPGSFKQLIHLQYLDLNGCSKLTFTPGNLDILENITMLDFVEVAGCTALQQLPHHITNQDFLRELNILKTGLTELPTNMGNLGNLQKLLIGSPLLTSLPSSTGNLSSLTHLEITRCQNLESLPESMRCLNLLDYLGISFSEVKSFPKDILALTNLRTLNIFCCRSMPFEFVHCSMSRLEHLRLQFTQVSRISISQASCPSLETLYLKSNDDLTEIENLPPEVKSARIYGCRILKNISGIKDLGKLQTLEIKWCPELHELPGLSNLVSIEGITLEECPKVKRIEGLECLRKLEELRVRTFLEEPGMGCLQYMEKLKSLELMADNISALDHCIQSLQKWPEELIICGGGVNGASSLVNTFTDLNLPVVEAVFNRCNGWVVECPEVHLSNGAVIVCYVVNCARETDMVINSWSYLGLKKQVDISNMRVREGRWAWIAVFKYVPMKIEYKLCKREGVSMEKGMLAIGEEES